MSIYLGHIPSDGQTIAPALAARGIRLLRAPAGDVYITSQVQRVQLGYRFYKTSMSPKGTINLDCIGPLVAVLRIFSNFLKAHSYSAFQLGEEKVDEDVDDITPTKLSAKRKTVGDQGYESL